MDYFGLELIKKPDPSYSKSILGIKTQVNSKGTFVVDIYPGSPSDMGGLRIGDQIMSVNKTQVNKNLDQWLRYFNENKEISLTLSRNQNIKEVQSKLAELKENKARNEATIDGIENRKKDLLYSVKNELNINSETNLLSSSDLVVFDLEKDNLPTIGQQQDKIEKIKTQRAALGSVNLRADEETQKFTDEIANREDNKRKTNYAVAAAGTFLLVPLLFLDLSEAEREEIRASRARYTHLHRLAVNKKCEGYSNSTPNQDLTMALRQLDKLYEENVITKEELLMKRSQLIEEFNF